MSDLFFVKRDLLASPAPESIPEDEWNAFVRDADLSSLQDGRPYFLNSSAPDEHLNSFVGDHLMSPRRSSPETWATYATQISLFLRHLAQQGRDWHNATRADINAYFFVRTSGNHQSVRAIQKSSWNVSSAAIVQLYEWGAAEGLVASLPFGYRRGGGGFRGHTRDVPDIRASNATLAPRFIPIDTYKNVWRPAVEEHRNPLRNGALADLLVTSGVRISEATDLDICGFPSPDHEQFRKRKSVPLTVVGKGRKRRDVLVPKHVARRVHFYLNSDEYTNVRRADGRQPLFLSNRGDRLTPRRVEQVFQSVSDATGVKLVPHGCRHTFAVYQLASLIRRMAKTLKERQSEGIGAYRQLLLDPLRALQLILGHSSISSTYIYLTCLEEAEQLVEESLADWTGWAGDHA